LLKDSWSIFVGTEDLSLVIDVGVVFAAPPAFFLLVSFDSFIGYRSVNLCYEGLCQDLVFSYALNTVDLLFS
jgi:hypothetical protein